MATSRRSFESVLAVGQIWEHTRSREQVLIEQIHRKDRQVKLRYRAIHTNGRTRSSGPFDGSFEYRTFDLLKKYYRLITWGAKELEQ